MLFGRHLGRGLFFANLSKSKFLFLDPSGPALLGVPLCFRETSDQNNYEEQEVIQLYREVLFYGQDPKSYIFRELINNLHD